MSQRPQRKRTFTIRTKFGSARQWRSRKNRPCDTCRRRKTACIIESMPPCRFCRMRGLSCGSTEDGPRQSVQAKTTRNVGCNDQGLTPSTSSTVEETGGSILGPDDSISAVDMSPAQTRPAATDALLPFRYANTEPVQWAAAGASSSAVSRGISNSTLEDPLIYTLEDNENMTAHSMGLCAEQDTDLLASFRSVIMDERNGVSADIVQVSPGDSVRNVPPVHFNLLHDQFQRADDIAKARSSQTIESMVRPHGPTLVRLFFKHVHPVYCVVSKTRFLRAYSADKLQIPASLRGAVYGLGSMFWNHEPAQEKPLHFDQHDLFEEAQSSLQREFHAPNLWKLQACLLLLYERPADNATIETPRTWVYSARTVASAQMIGLHRDPTVWQIAPWEKKLRKKLWSATYIADIWSSVCHGNPPLIYPTSFTTAEPSVEDLEFDEDVPEDLYAMVDVSSRTIDIATNARLLQMVKLSKILHELIDSYFNDINYEKTMSEPLRREAQLCRIKKKLDDWASMLPQCVTMRPSSESLAFQNNAPLRLAYFAVNALFYRALMSPASTTAKSDPASSLNRYFEAANADFRGFTQFMNDIDRPCLHIFWGGHARSQLTLCGNFLIYLFLLASTPEQVRAAFQLLERFHESLQRLREWADDDASLALVRPVALRIDSFFIQAARIMRSGAGPRSHGGPL